MDPIQQPVVAPTTDPQAVSTPATPVAQVVNPAQAQQIVDTSALIAQYEQRIRNLMSEKDKSINERNQAISQLTELQKQYTSAQEQTQSSLSAAANSAQQAIDRTTQLERELASERAKNVKLAALINRPHLAPYAALIPEVGDEEKVTEVLNQLEQIRNKDLESARAQQAPQFQAQTTPGTAPSPQSLLSSLYGNRANMNPMFTQPAAQNAPVAPGSTPAQMNPAASSDVNATIAQLFDEARKVGTAEAFDDARNRAVLLAQSSLQSLGR